MKVIIAVISIFALLVIALIMFVLVSGAKYDYILEKDDDGNWKEVPVFHPCGEEIDEEFIKLWHERRKEYLEDMNK